MTRQWFVLHTFTGQEQKVCDFIEAEKRLRGLDEYFGETLTPTEKRVSTRQGKKITTVKKLYPGYVFLEAALYDDTRDIIEPVWTFIKGIQGVIGFLGGDRPVPMSSDEVDSVRGAATDAEAKPKPAIVFHPGEIVRITDGPFKSASASGPIEEVDPERGKIKVQVDIFGRKVLVELEYWQVERDVSDAEAQPE